ncbi:MAG: GspH/FimT family pseudopilin [Sutterellaceae bacterium]|nr:GspH/FimT family pseudopilin [Burkholderiaceae bacterium]MDW8429724.1 GspH/FimT family pseudopilin [Sutterellaceae bacterium]
METLIALLLGVLLLMFPAASLVALFAAESPQAGARAVMDLLEAARAEAALRRVPVGICGLAREQTAAASTLTRCTAAATPWRDGGLVMFIDGNLNGWRDDGEMVLRTVRLAGVSVDSPQPAIVFRPSATLAHPTALALAVESNGQTRLLCVGLDGFVRLAHPSVGCLR